MKNYLEFGKNRILFLIFLKGHYLISIILSTFLKQEWFWHKYFIKISLDSCMRIKVNRARNWRFNWKQQEIILSMHIHIIKNKLLSGWMNVYLAIERKWNKLKICFVTQYHRLRDLKTWRAMKLFLQNSFKAIILINYQKVKAAFYDCQVKLTI